jgi:hypothetical protein
MVRAIPYSARLRWSILRYEKESWLVMSPGSPDIFWDLARHVTGILVMSSAESVEVTLSGQAVRITMDDLIEGRTIAMARALAGELRERFGCPRR